MKRLIAALSFCFLLTLTGCGGNADKIIGSWTIVKVGDKEAPKDSKGNVEFTKDGKMLLKDGDKVEREATYKIEGDKITVTRKDFEGKEKVETMSIKSINGDTLIIHDDKLDKDVELKKRN